MYLCATRDEMYVGEKLILQLFLRSTGELSDLKVKINMIHSCDQNQEYKNEVHFLKWELDKFAGKNNKKRMLLERGYCKTRNKIFVLPGLIYYIFCTIGAGCQGTDSNCVHDLRLRSRHTNYRQICIYTGNDIDTN